jgi:hypothetical protein
LMAVDPTQHTRSTERPSVDELDLGGDGDDAALVA